MLRRKVEYMTSARDDLSNTTAAANIMTQMTTPFEQHSFVLYGTPIQVILNPSKVSELVFRKATVPSIKL